MTKHSQTAKKNSLIAAGSTSMILSRKGEKIPTVNGARRASDSLKVRAGLDMLPPLRHKDSRDRGLRGAKAFGADFKTSAPQVTALTNILIWVFKRRTRTNGTSRKN